MASVQTKMAKAMQALAPSPQQTALVEGYKSHTAALAQPAMKGPGRAPGSVPSLSVVKIGNAGNIVDTAKANATGSKAKGGALALTILQKAVEDGQSWKMFFTDVMELDKPGQQELRKVLNEQRKGVREQDVLFGHKVSPTAMVRISEIIRFSQACEKGLKKHNIVDGWNEARGTSYTWESMSHAFIVSSARLYLQSQATGGPAAGRTAQTIEAKVRKYLLTNVDAAKLSAVSKIVAEMATQIKTNADRDQALKLMNKKADAKVKMAKNAKA